MNSVKTNGSVLIIKKGMSKQTFLNHSFVPCVMMEQAPGKSGGL